MTRRDGVTNLGTILHTAPLTPSFLPPHGVLSARIAHGSRDAKNFKYPPYHYEHM